MKLRSLLAAALLGVCAVVHAAPLTWSMQLLPGPELTSAPGTTAGWGYTISNHDDTYWLAPASLNHDLFEYGSPSSLFDYPLLAPGASLTVSYGGGDGLFEFTWDAAAPWGFSNVGVFEVEAEWWVNETGDFFAVAESVRMAYSIQVGERNEVPVPGTLALSLGWVLVLMLRARPGARRLR